MNKKITLGLLVIACTQMVIAQDVSGSISPKLSTLGVGVEYKYPVADDIAVAVGAYGGTHRRSNDIDGVPYNMDVKLRNVMIAGDYHPMDNGLYVSGGVVLNGTKIEGERKLQNGSYEFNGQKYAENQISSADVTADFRKVAPYVGIGWDNGNKGEAGWSVSASAGVMFSGSPEVEFDVTCKTKGGCGNLKDNVEAARRDLEEDVEHFKYYPVLSAGAMYRF